MNWDLHLKKRQKGRGSEQKHGVDMKQSMSGVAHCIDNGPMEGVWGIAA